MKIWEWMFLVSVICAVNAVLIALCMIIPGFIMVKILGGISANAFVLAIAMMPD